MSTEVALRHTPGAVVEVTDEFAERFPTIAPNAELAEILADTGIELTPRDLPQIKFPSGKGPYFWSTISSEGKPAAVDTLRGVLVYFRPQRAFWPDPEPTGNAPSCSSTDGKVPVPGGQFAPDGESAHENPGGTCRTCPMAAQGSAALLKPGARGSACRDQRVLFIAEEGKSLPTVVNLPPTSIKPFNAHIVNLVATNTHWRRVEVELSLEKATNAAGNEFASLVIKPAGKLDDRDFAAVQDYGRYIENLVRDADPAQFIEGVDVKGDVEASGGIKVGADVEDDEE